jgi:hypothetical protein
MNRARLPMRYEPPEIRDHGRLSVVTAFDGGGLHFAQISIGSLPGGGATPPATTPPATSTPVPTQGVLDTSDSGNGTTPDVPGSPTVPDATGVEGATDSSPGSTTGNTGVESGSGGGGVGSGGDSLPFTGMAVGPVAALGAGLATAGATLRRHIRRS